MPAQEAYRLGLIHMVVGSVCALDEAMFIAEQLARLSPHSVRATKKALNRQLEALAREGLEFDIEAESESFDTSHVKALVAKRAARKGDTHNG